MGIIAVQKYKNFESTNINHINNLIDWGFTDLNIAVNLADFAYMPGLKWDSPAWMWRGYINHCFTFYTDGMHAWTFDGREKAFWSGPRNEKMSAAFKLCQRLKWNPIVMFSHAEEQGSWITRAPDYDKWMWLRRFAKEYARYLKDKYGFANVDMEPWNEPNECMVPDHYANVAVNLIIGWLEVFPKAKIHIGGVDIRHTAYLDKVLTNKPLMQRATHISPHILTVDEWKSVGLDNYYNKAKAMGKKLSLMEINPMGRWDLLDKIFIKDKNNNIIGAKATDVAFVLLIRNSVVGNSNDFTEDLIFKLDNPNEWEVIHSRNIERTKEFIARMKSF